MPAPIRFGAFEADLSAGDLRRNGSRLKLQNQPFRILGALLERPGELVTRDELKNRIWPDNTLVDFERGLNKAINRLRIALKDSVEHTSLIETLPRRGYRFIGAIEQRLDSVAVLPIVNLSGSSDHEHWADGLTDELIGRIAQIKTLKVISRTSAMCFKASLLKLPDIIRELDVDAVVQGSMLIINNRVRIRLGLIDARERHLWSDQFEGDCVAIALLHEQLADAVTERLRVHVRGAGRGSGKLRPHGAPRYEAHEAYLKGRFFWNKRTASDLKTAIQYFERAITLEPSYATAHAGLADAFIMQAIFGLCAPRDVYPKAKASAEKALEIDDNLAEAHNCLADIHKGYTWHWALAEKEYARALQLSPSYSIAHQWYGGLLLIMGRDAKALEECNRARALDPLSIPINGFLGYAYMKTGQFDKAIAACAKAVELDPHNPFGHWTMARAFDTRDDLRAALAAAKKAAKLAGDQMPYLAQVGYAWARVGHNQRAQAILNRVFRIRKNRYVSAYPIAAIYSALGDTDAAFEWLEKAYAERTPRLVGLVGRPDREFDRIQTDRRFADLLRRLSSQQH